jgi:hypothetical protein
MHVRVSFGVREAAMETEGQAHHGSMRRVVAAGAVGGVFAVALLAVLGVLLMRRMGPRLMRSMMKRMMAAEECGEGMRECMERCGCGESPAKR